MPATFAPDTNKIFYQCDSPEDRRLMYLLGAMRNEGEDVGLEVWSLSRKYPRNSTSSFSATYGRNSLSTRSKQSVTPIIWVGLDKWFSPSLGSVMSNQLHTQPNLPFFIFADEYRIRSCARYHRA